MGKEIERKFLVTATTYRELGKAGIYRQGYLSTVKERTVRVRTADGKGFLTIKGIAEGAARAEYEYAIPIADADEMLANLCEIPLIEKCRYKVPYGGFTWEIDEFFGENEGLTVAEIELPSETTRFSIPTWIGRDVTGNPAYFNANLTKHPYKKWTNEEKTA